MWPFLQALPWGGTFRKAHVKPLQSLWSNMSKPTRSEETECTSCGTVLTTCTRSGGLLTFGWTRTGDGRGPSWTTARGKSALSKAPRLPRECEGGKEAHKVLGINESHASAPGLFSGEGQSWTAPHRWSRGTEASTFLDNESVLSFRQKGFKMLPSYWPRMIFRSWQWSHQWKQGHR